METEKVYQEKTARTIRHKQEGSGTLQFVDNRPVNLLLQKQNFLVALLRMWYDDVRCI